MHRFLQIQHQAKSLSSVVTQVEIAPKIRIFKNNSQINTKTIHGDCTP